MTSGIETNSALGKQIGGDHYKNMKFQPIEFILANNLGFCEGNAIKYICRYKAKNGIEDLIKAKHYIDMLIEIERKKNDICTDGKNESTKVPLDRRREAGLGVWPDMVAGGPTDRQGNILC